MDNNQIEISIVVPMFNEEQNVGRTSSRLMTMMNDLRKKYEVIYVNDGSTDGTLQACEAVKKLYSQLKIVSYKPNQGRGKALKEGFRSARGKYIFTIDFDLSYDESHILKMYDVFQADPLVDIVLISAYMKGGRVEGIPKFRLLVSKIGNLLLSFSFPKKIYTSTCVVRGYKRDAIRSLSIDSSGKEIHLEILSKALMLGYNIKEIPGILEKRRIGKSKFVFRDTSKTHLLFFFTERPTYYLFIAGILFLGLSIMSGVLLAYNRFIPNAPKNMLTDVVSPSLVIFLFVVSAFSFVFSLIVKLFGSLKREILKIQLLLLKDKED